MILDFQNKWPTGKILRVSFLSDGPGLHDRVMVAAKQWEEYTRIHFEHVEPNEYAEIRVRFRSGKNDSKIGTDSLMFGMDEPTVCFDLLHEESSDDDVNKYVLHEFGHVLGFIHEHLHPTKKINWKKDKAVEYYNKNFGYSKDDCDKNLFRQYVPSALSYSEFDPESIMMYPIPAEITEDGENFNMNSDLSETDKKVAKIFYPEVDSEPIVIAPDREKYIEGELKNYCQCNIYKFPFEVAGSKCYVEAETEGKEEITLALYSIELENKRKGCVNYILPNDEYQGGKGNKPQLETYPATLGDLYLKVVHLNPAGKAKYRLKIYFL